MTDNDDHDVWREVTKTVKPITGKKRVTPEIKKPSRLVVRLKDDVLPKARSVQPAPLPQKQVRKLRQQKIPVEAKLDLHGMTVARAHSEVIGFLGNAIRNGLRCVEIVTGRGDPERGTGQLRRSLPLWLQDQSIKSYILHMEANPASRGGSWLIMLRRNRSAPR